jgi:hypothetical protein
MHDNRCILNKARGGWGSDRCICPRVRNAKAAPLALARTAAPPPPGDRPPADALRKVREMFERADALHATAERAEGESRALRTEAMALREALWTPYREAEAERVLKAAQAREETEAREAEAALAGRLVELARKVAQPPAPAPTVKAAPRERVKRIRKTYLRDPETGDLTGAIEEHLLETLA